jgi:hypothetical protein
MDWLNDPDRYCQTPADYQLCDRLRAAINASDVNTRQTANNRLFALLDNHAWVVKMRSIAKNNRFFAEALDNLWLWLFSTRKDGRSCLSAFEPRSAIHGLTGNFLAYLKNKFGWLLKTAYRQKNKQFPLSLDALLEIDPHKYEAPDHQLMPWETLQAGESSAENQAFLAYCRSQPQSLNVAYGQKQTQAKGFTCNAYLQNTYFSDDPLIQEELGKKFGISIDTVNDHIKKFRILLKQEYTQFVQGYGAKKQLLTR